MHRVDKLKQQEENKRKRAEYQNSLIWAMYDSGYDISDIADQVGVSMLMVKHRLGQEQIITNSI